MAAHPDYAQKLTGNNPHEIGSRDYIAVKARVFAEARKPKHPKPPNTKSDEIVSFVLEHYFDVPADRLQTAKKEHALAMAAENIVGDLLERYLAVSMEKIGWAWCSGSLVKAVDFLKPPQTAQGTWRLLQIKNRDNSENSSSSAIRTGTNIQKWFRSFAKTGETNWAKFPDVALQKEVSEEAFRSFVRNYLIQIKQEQHGKNP